MFVLFTGGVAKRGYNKTYCNSEIWETVVRNQDPLNVYTSQQWNIVCVVKSKYASIWDNCLAVVFTIYSSLRSSYIWWSNVILCVFNYYEFPIMYLSISRRWNSSCGHKTYLPNLTGVFKPKRVGKDTVVINCQTLQLEHSTYRIRWLFISDVGCSRYLWEVTT